MSNSRFGCFVQDPTCERYLRLRTQVMRTRRYDPRASDLAELQECLEQQELSRVLRRAAQLAASYRLSPRFHFLAGRAAQQMGDNRAFCEHREAFHACLCGILATGNGRADQPHVVTYLTDERDVAMALNLSIRCHHVVQAPHGVLDVLTAHDGRELWFDVTELLAAQSPATAQVAASNV